MMETNMTTEKYVPFDPAINPASLIKFSLGHGDFYVCNAGRMRDVENIIFYGDDCQQMYVYAETASDPDAGPNRFKIIVIEANMKSRGGAPVDIPKMIQAFTEANLRHVLTTRQFHRLSLPARGDDIPSKVEFAWRVI